jgi:hypothetical protein
LTRSGDSELCPATGTWTASYAIEEDPLGAPLFLTALP